MAERESVQNEREFNERVVGNPIHAYKAVKRFVVDWRQIEKDLAKDDWKDTNFKLKKRRLGSVVPREDDLNGSAQSIIKLQDTYQLSIRDLAKGAIGFGKNRYSSKAQLNAQDCLFMGKHSFNSGSLATSLEWFEEAWHKAGRESNKTIRQDQVQRFFDHASEQHDSRVLNGEKSPDLFPQPVKMISPFKQRETVYQQLNEEFKRNQTRISGTIDHMGTMDLPRYKALCRGEELRVRLFKNNFNLAASLKTFIIKFQSPKFVATLKCHLDRTKDPYFILQPVKVEVLHRHPSIWMYHEVITPEEMKEIRTVASPLVMLAYFIFIFSYFLNSVCHTHGWIPGNSLKFKF